MNQSDLIEAISEKFFLTKVDSKEIIELILEMITNDVKKGKRSYIRNFGSFYRKQKAKKKVRHPETGKIITIPSKMTMKFKPSKTVIKKIESANPKKKRSRAKTKK